MSTITAALKIKIDTINELLEHVNEHGSENVIIKSFDNDMINSYDDILNLTKVLNSESVSEIISRVFYNKLYNKVLESTDFSEIELNDHLFNIAIEKKAFIRCVRRSTTIEQLNKLAEANIINLLYIGHLAHSIDLPFIEKYGMEMDLYSVIRNSSKSDVIELAKKLLDEE